MQPSAKFNFFAVVFTLAIALFLFSPVRARAQSGSHTPDPVIVQGDPPLTAGTVARFVNYEAWLLEIPFTKGQRNRQRAMLVEDWKDPQQILIDTVTALNAGLIEAATADEREFMQVDRQEENLKYLRAGKGNADSQWLLAAYEAAHPPIAAGNPPLTESMVSHYVSFVSWLLEIPRTESLNERLRAMLIADWKKPKEIENDMKTLNWQLELARVKEGTPQRDFTRIVSQPQVVASMRADKSNPDEQFLVAAYDAAHRPLVAGNPPLLRQASDAWAELYCFVHNQAGQPHMDASEELKDDLAHKLTESWAKFPAETRKSVADMPRTWALLRAGWARGTEADHQKTLAAWQPVVNPTKPADQQMAVAEKGQARLDAFEAKDPNTVSQQELLQAAEDAELVALQDRKQGTQQGLQRAAFMEDYSRTLHTGDRQAYVNLRAQWKANEVLLANMRAQYAAHGAMMRARAISNMYVLGDAAMANVITNINNSPYQTIVVPVAPK